MPTSLIIIPTYNEKDNIEKIIRKVFSMPFGFHILVVDDSSPDGTSDIVKKLIPEFQDKLFIEERSGKMGLGTAYIHGFKWGINKGYDYLFEMDADFSHSPEDLVRLQNTCENEGADVAVGSRYIKEGKIKNWPFGRVLMSYFASLYVRGVLSIPIHDTTAGFMCYKRKVLEAIKLDEIEFVGYAFQIEMKYKAYQLGFKIKEVPITFTDRKEGVSKMNKSIFKEAFIGVLKMRFNKFDKND